MFSVCKAPESILAQSDTYNQSKLDFVNVTKLFQNLNKQTLRHAEKPIEFSPTLIVLGSRFQAVASIWVRLMWAAWVWRKYGFQSSAAFNLYTTLRFGLLHACFPLSKVNFRFLSFHIMKGGTQGFPRHEVSDKQKVLFEDVSPSTAFSIRQHK